jgi:hypothetical protein
MGLIEIFLCPTPNALYLSSKPYFLPAIVLLL